MDWPPSMIINDYYSIHLIHAPTFIIIGLSKASLLIVSVRIIHMAIRSVIGVLGVIFSRVVTFVFLRVFFRLDERVSHSKNDTDAKVFSSD
jgi:hypothetical protein